MPICATSMLFWLAHRLVFCIASYKLTASSVVSSCPLRGFTIVYSGVDARRSLVEGISLRVRISLTSPFGLVSCSATNSNERPLCRTIRSAISYTSL